MHAIYNHKQKGETVKKVFIFIMAVACAVLVIVRVNQFINPPAVTCEAKSMVAEYNDTMWGLTNKALCTGGWDMRDRVDAVINENGGSAKVMPGQLIIFPQGK